VPANPCDKGVSAAAWSKRTIPSNILADPISRRIETMNQRLALLAVAALILLAPATGMGVPRTILMEKYSNGW